MNIEMRAELSRQAWLMLHSVVLERRLRLVQGVDFSVFFERLRANARLHRIRSFVSVYCQSRIDADDLKALLQDEALLIEIVDGVSGQIDPEPQRTAAIWLELARHVLRLRELFCSLFDAAEADQELARFRKQIKVNGKVELPLLLKILDQYEKLLHHPARIAGSAGLLAALLLESLESFLIRAGSNWPVNCLLALGGVDRPKVWWDETLAGEARFEPGELDGQREQLAEFLIEQLPRNDFPPERINTMLTQLTGASIRARRPGQFPKAERGWIANWKRRGGVEILGLDPYVIVAAAGQSHAEIDETCSPSPPAAPQPAVEKAVDPAELLAAGGFAASALPGLAEDYRKAENPADRQEVLSKMLDELVLVQDAGKEQPVRPNSEQFDLALALLRRLVQNDQFTITPARWTFSGACNYADLTDAERSGMRFAFHEAPPGRVVRLRKLGLSRPESIIREPEATVSVGKPAPSLQALLDILKESGTAGADGVRNRIRKWLPSILLGGLEEEIKDFFIDLYGALGESWRRDDPGNAERFNKAFEHYLESQFGFRMFEPSNRSDHPKDWMNLVGNRAPQTGRVRRIFQPGLLDPQGKLMIPASVEVE